VGTVVGLQEWLLRPARAVGITMNLQGKIFVTKIVLRYFTEVSLHSCGPGGVVDIATAYGLDGLGIESRWGRDFPQLSRPPLRPTQPPVKWVPDLSRG
jgi:hypothetical protein